MILAFVKGIYLGLGLVMPLGPLNLYILNNSSMQKKFVSVLPVVVVAAICDSSLVIGAVCGVDFISQIGWFKTAIMMLGTTFLLYMGVQMWRATSRTVELASPTLPVSKQIMYSMTLSLFNPHSILDTFVVIGAVSTTYIGFEKHVFTFGCVFADVGWFTFLALSGYFLHKMSFGQKLFYMINKVSAVIMIALGLQMLYELLFLSLGNT